MFVARARVALLTLCVSLLAGLVCSCGTDPVVPAKTAEFVIAEGCNPVAATGTAAAGGAGGSGGGASRSGDCLLPYPSNFFLSGGQVSLPAAAQPAFNGVPVDIFAPHRPDGFSVGSPILVLFPDGVDSANLVFHTDDVSRSLGDDTPTVLLDADTGERILHFAELDPRAESDDRRALVIHPLVRLANAHRYIVAIRNLIDRSGANIAPPAGFKSLRDDAGKAHPALAALSPHYESDVFPALDNAGVARGSIILAWDFTTSSEANATSDMRRIQEDAAARLAAAPPEIEILKVEDAPAAHIGRRIEATITVPLYVDSANPGAKLNYDSEGHVVANGTAKVPITIWIPSSVMNRAAGDPPARLMQYGHGFFSSRFEVEDFVIKLADQKGFVVVASDWWGLSADDKGPVANVILNDPPSIPFITDRLQQAMANLMYAAAAAKGPLSTLSAMQIQGQKAYDPNTLYFYGISLGSLLGNTYLALTPDVERASMSVGGYDYSTIIFRSQAFIPLITIIALGVPDALDQQKMIAELQSTLDRVDGLTYAPHLLQNRFPASSPSLRIIMQVGLGDALVNNLASFLEARTLGLSLLEPSPQEIQAVPSVMSPQTQGSTITLFDFGVTPNDSAVAPLTPNPVHNGVRASQGSIDQIDQFFRLNGPIVQACSEVCDPD